ncbi:unnamed protein product [Thlaspi arvense]|uniref:Zinc finger GRF-type domain-containing protein n=1 Tax=Thlaspi arvense TaxID=13288 RepID=A0AAU9SAG8_THLAR|nr:unnamed protein product [Thlaspi arvense]
MDLKNEEVFNRFASKNLLKSTVEMALRQVGIQDDEPDCCLDFWVRVGLKMDIHSYTQPSSDSGSDSSGVRRRLARIEIPVKEYGIMNQCYCGARAIIDTCRSTMDPGRRFFTCPNVGDGECHI